MEITPEDRFVLHRSVRNLVKNKNTTALDLGEILLTIFEAGAYKDMAESFTQYVAMPEVNIPLSTANRYMSIVKKYIRELGLPRQALEGLDTNSLQRIKNLVTHDNYKEWLSRVENLSRADVYRLAKFGDVDAMTCKHEWIQEPIRYKCPHCGEITRHPDNV